MSKPSRSDAMLTGACILAGASLMALAILLGAFGAHLLRDQLDPARLAAFRTGVLYQQIHALGLVVLGLVAALAPPSRALAWSARLMLLGMLLFSGSIYLVAAGLPRWLGAITPVGGLSFMVAWLLLALHGWRSRVAVRKVYSDPAG